VKLLRYGEPGAEKPGILDKDGNIRGLGDIIEDISGQTLAEAKLTSLISQLDLSDLPLVPSDVRIGPCVANVGKFICIGLNYADHARESGMPVPEEPEVFTKATSCISGPNDDIIQPRNSDRLDWEAELAFVIGKKASYVSEENGASHIAGYFICNDVSERSFQFDKGCQWDKGKSCDTFGPIGPWLVTPDEVADPLNLDIWLEVNGHRYQDGNTRTMLFSPGFVVSYLSQFMSLYPGDIVTTGTPPGVGLGLTPPSYLKPGDVVELGIEGLGRQRQTVISAD